MGSASSYIVVECAESCVCPPSDTHGSLAASSSLAFSRRAARQGRTKPRPLRRLASRGTPSARCPMGLSECAMTRPALRAKPRPASSACRSTSRGWTRCCIRHRRSASEWGSASCRQTATLAVAANDVQALPGSFRGWALRLWGCCRSDGAQCRAACRSDRRRNRQRGRGCSGEPRRGGRVRRALA